MYVTMHEIPYSVTIQHLGNVFRLTAKQLLFIRYALEEVKGDNTILIPKALPTLTKGNEGGKSSRTWKRRR